MLLRRNNILLYLLCGSLLFIFSCKKGTSNGTSGNNPGSELLVKTIEWINKDSIITLYHYDAARRWIGTTGEVISQGMVVNHLQFTIVRDADGIITNTIYKNGGSTDSLYFKVGYDKVLSKYESISSYKRSSSPFFRDSLQIQYDNQQKIAGYLHYMIDYPNLSDVTLVGKTVFSRDVRGNIVLEKTTQFSNGSSTDSTKVIYSYDNKVRPIQLSDGEAFVIQDGRYAVNNKISTEAYGITGVPAFHMENKFVYNSLNKPVTSVSTLSDNVKKIFIEFYYQ
jgi:hypothetical protein